MSFYPKEVLEVYPDVNTIPSNFVPARGRGNPIIKERSSSIKGSHTYIKTRYALKNRNGVQTIKIYLIEYRLLDFILICS
jgi:hypothetical protein